MSKVVSRDKTKLTILDPGTGHDWTSAPDNEAADVDAAVDAAHTAFLIYSKAASRTRSQCLMMWSTLIQENIEDLAKIITYETGKSISDSLFELDYAVNAARCFSGEAERIHGTAFNASTPHKKVFTINQPIGVAVALVPWKLPVA